MPHPNATPNRSQTRRVRDLLRAYDIGDELTLDALAARSGIAPKALRYVLRPYVTGRILEPIGPSTFLVACPLYARDHA